MKKGLLTLSTTIVSLCLYGQDLPLTAGSSYPLTGPLYINTADNNWVNGLNIHNSTNSSSSRTGIALSNDANSLLLLYKQASGNSDANDNILYSAQGNLRFYTGGNESLKITSDGKVGIGTTSPTTKLDVNGSIGTAANGNVLTPNAIGTYFGQLLSTSDNPVTSDYFFGMNTKMGYDRNLVLEARTADGPGSIIFKTVSLSGNGGNAPERMRISGNGNVGIGTTDPTSKLAIQGAATEIHIKNDATNTLAMGNYDGNSHWIKSINLGVALTPISFQASNFNFDTGNVGIGTTSPFTIGGTAKFSINASSGAPFTFGISSTDAVYLRRYGVGQYQFQTTGTGGNDGNLSLQSYGGNVAIGTTDSQGYKLAVNGSAIAESMTVKLHGSWPDYVFKKEYKLPSLTDVKTYIDKNNHLPDMPSEAEVSKNGANLGEIVKIQTKKIEELTLYLIEKDQKDKEKDTQLQLQQEQINQLKEQVTALIKAIN